MHKQITFKGTPLILVGRNLPIGSFAPDFRVSAQDLKEVTLNNFKDKIKVISSFPSLDTPVCDLQVKEFNKRAADLSGDIVVIGISKDLPFAQKRFCDTFDIKKEVVLSDYKTSSFGINYGLLIKELNLLARSVMIIDKGDTLRYFKLVDELTHAPDYDAALKALEEVVKNPKINAVEQLSGRCKPCEIGTPSLPKAKIAESISKFKSWELVEDKKLVKEFKFNDFVEAKYFLDLISVIAEEQQHHPSLSLIYNKLKITLTTHASGGLTENDFIMAQIIESLSV